MHAIGWNHGIQRHRQKRKGIKMCRQNKPGTAKSRVIVENARTRVTRWSFGKRGDNTGWHKHEFDYIVVPLFDGNLEIENADGKRNTAELRNGNPYFREIGIEHDVFNGNDFEVTFLEIEFLEQPLQARGAN
jgi:beta-alanine degradation protein BauB